MARKKRNAAALSRPEPPQRFEHRVECSLQALDYALLGCQSLIRFLLAEQGHEIPQYHMLDSASGDWRRARRWLKNASLYRRRVKKIKRHS